MSFSVTFYTCTANPRKLDKSGNMTAIGTAITSNTKHEIDIINPAFVVDYDASLLPANYAYIAEFNRYYYITIATDTAQKMIVRGNVDPLFSHMSAIKNCPVNVIRAELGAPTYVHDSKYPIQPDKYIFEGIDFDAAPNFYTGAEHYVIITR